MRHRHLALQFQLKHNHVILITCPSKLYKVARRNTTPQLTDESGVSNIYEPVGFQQCKNLWNNDIDGWLPVRASSYGDKDIVTQT